MSSYTAATTLDEAIAALAAGARPVAGGSDLVVAARHGKAPLPDDLVAIHGIAELGEISVEDGELVLGALVNHAAIEAQRRDRRGLVGPRRRQRARGLALDAPRRHDRRQPHELLAGHGHGRSAARARRRGRAALAERLAQRPAVRALDGARPHVGAGRRAAREPSGCRRCRPARAARTCGSSTGGRWRSRSSAPRPSSRSTAMATSRPAASRSRRWPPRSSRSAAAEAAIVGKPVSEETLAAVAAGASADATPISDVRASERYRRHTVGVMARRAVEVAAARARGEQSLFPSTAPRVSARPSEDDPMSVSITLNVNGVALPRQRRGRPHPASACSAPRSA